LQQAAFVNAEFHTGYLDEVLRQRQGTPFLTTETSLEEVAAVAAALASASRRPPGTAVSRSEWRSLARVEGLRS
jgi:hypothetical protein